MQLTVLNIAYPFALVGPDAPGSSEHVVSQLDSALTRAGHDSVVIACEGSSTEGILVAMPRPRGVIDESTRQRLHAQYREAIAGLLKKWRFDVIHMHGVDFHEYLPPPGAPLLVTLHMPVQWYSPGVFQTNRPQTYFHCVSESQRLDCPPRVNVLPALKNHVSGEAVCPARRKRNFVLALGKICPEEGLHHALDAAKLANVPMALAGEVVPDPSHITYLENQIAPRLDRLRRFIGPVTAQSKKRLLGSARCLLAPGLAPETNSLLAMEAMACGTPVIAFESSAQARLVDEGRTGFVVRNAEEMADAIRRVELIDPEMCRQSARERFSMSHAVEDCFELYHQLAAEARKQNSIELAMAETAPIAGISSRKI